LLANAEPLAPAHYVVGLAQRLWKLTHSFEQKRPCKQVGKNAASHNEDSALRNSANTAMFSDSLPAGIGLAVIEWRVLSSAFFGLMIG
jgi:hypothetical protein